MPGPSLSCGAKTMMARLPISFRQVLRLCLIALATVLVTDRCSWAQLEVARSFPPLAYYNAFAVYNLGDFQRGFETFRAAGRLGLRAGNERWADSICYHTMMGECLYRVGEPIRALDQYNQALTVFLLNRDWLRRVEFPAIIGASTSRARQAIAWGARTSAMGDFPRSMQVLFGDANLQNALQQGGVLAPPEIRSVNVTEIVRCTALALRRRAELMGPLCPTDPLSAQLLVAIESRIGRPNHWSQVWIEALRGMALLGMGKQGEAADALQRSLLVSGQFDHPLTGQALMELGRLGERQANYGLAMESYLQASLAAGEYEQPDLVAEALHRAAAVHLISNAQGMYGPLLPAAVWAKRQKYAELYASLIVDLAEQQFMAGDVAAAEASLADVRQLIGRRQVASAQVISRLAFHSAATLYQGGRDKSASTALQQALAMQRAISTWLLQITTLDTLYQANSPDLTEREASTLYELLLREPTAADWASDPLDCLAVKSVPKEMAFQNWFDLSMGRGEQARAIEIAERMRRQKFFAQLPLAGRPLALRWLLEAPPAVLNDDARRQRQDLSVRYPALDDLSRQLQAARSGLATLQKVVADDDADHVKAMKDQARLLAATSTKYDRLLNSISLRRLEIPESFPPLLSVEQIQSRLAENQLILSFMVTPRAAYATLLSASNQAVWKLASPDRTRKGTAALLREIGMSGESSTLNAKKLASEKWKAVSKALVEYLIDAPQLGFWKKFDELIIVPESFLWYLPFECLMVANEDGEEVPLISAIRIRYAPTMGLAVPDALTHKRDPVTTVVLGQLFPRDDVELAGQQLTEMQSLMEGLRPLSDKPLAPTGLLRANWDRLLVLDDVDTGGQGPFKWTPASVDHGKPHTSLQRWMELPWGGPTEVYLPGFHTDAETGLRQSSLGDEIYLSLTGLMASGARTIILSRWRTGGQVSFDLMREYLQELPNSTPDTAWQRTVQLVRGTQIDPSWEPRIRLPQDATETLTAEHPFFWSGYILCDRGTLPDKRESNIGEEDDTLRPAAADPSAGPNG